MPYRNNKTHLSSRYVSRNILYCLYIHTLLSSSGSSTVILITVVVDNERKKMLNLSHYSCRLVRRKNVVELTRKQNKTDRAVEKAGQLLT
jgi:hypothetical protein